MNFTEDKDYFFIKKPVYIRLLILIKHKKDKNYEKDYSSINNACN